MLVTRTIEETRAAVESARAAGLRIACVPTMGALHAGHLSLIQAARSFAGERVFVVVTLFVNPTQFGPNEDFARYPRNEAADFRLCEESQAQMVFTPPAEQMYASDAATTVRVARLTQTLCGPFRPGHFEGVATVVCKLLNITAPHAAFFGEKDYQQLVVIRRMVLDLNMPVEIVGCPTVREPDGLAMSSRNRYLSPHERKQAVSLYRALSLGAERIAGGERQAARIIDAMRRTIEDAGPAQIDYASVVDPNTLEELPEIRGPVRLAVAVRLRQTRLIDNLAASPPAPTGANPA